MVFIVISTEYRLEYGLTSLLAMKLLWNENAPNLVTQMLWGFHRLLYIYLFFFKDRGGGGLALYGLFRLIGP